MLTSAIVLATAFSIDGKDVNNGDDAGNDLSNYEIIMLLPKLILNYSMTIFSRYDTWKKKMATLLESIQYFVSDRGTFKTQPNT